MISWYDKPKQYDWEELSVCPAYYPYYEPLDLGKVSWETLWKGKDYKVSIPRIEFINPIPGQITDLHGGYVAYRNPEVFTLTLPEGDGE